MRRTILFFSIICTSLCYANDDYEKAHIAYNNTDIEAAYIHLKNALTAEPNDLPSQILMANVLLQKHYYLDSVNLFQDALANSADINLILNDYVNALMLSRQYQQVVALNDESEISAENTVQWLLYAANAYTSLEKPEQASLYLHQAKTIAPESISVLQTLASYYLQQSSYLLAGEEIKKLISISINNAKTWYLQSQWYATQFNDEKSFQALEKAYELDPLDPFIQRAIAHGYTSKKEYKKALRIINKVLEVSKDDPYALLLKSELLAKSNRTEESKLILEDISQRLSLLSDEDKKQQASLLYVASVSAYVKGDYETARSQLLSYLKDTPDDLFAINLLVSIYTNQGQWNKAQTLLGDNLLLIKDDLSLSLLLSEIYLQNNRLFKSEQILNQLEQDYKNHTDYIRARALWFSQNNQLNESITLLDQAIANNNDTSLLVTKALILKNNFKVPLAQKITEQLLTINPNNSDFLKLSASLQLAQQQWQAALTTLELILNIQPNDYSSLFNKANALAASGELASALAVTNNLILRTPDASVLLILRAKIYRDLNEKITAVAILEKVISKDKSNISALEALVDIHIQQREYLTAIDLLERLSKLSFLNPNYIKKKVQVYLALDDKSNVKKQLQIFSGLVQSADDYYQLARLQSASLEHKASKESLVKALNHPSLLPAEKLRIELALVQVELQLKNYPASDRILKQIEKLQPKNSFITNLRGDYYYLQKNFEQAHQYYIAALTLNTANNQALIKLYQLAQIDVKADIYVKKINTLLRENETLHLARNLLADHYLNNGELAKALPHYEKLSTLTFLSNRAAILNNLANIHQSNNLVVAATYAKQAIQLAPTSAAFLDTYGWIIAQQGQYNQALTLLRNAYAMDSTNPAISFHLAYVLTQLGREIEALTAVKNSLSVGTSFDELDSAKKLYNTLTNNISEL
jgi:putative PEP-CTERM system TPR-repeat lipoprotein